jgi:prepilin-type N-terminal cleavage/methylation domain-containing protein
MNALHRRSNSGFTLIELLVVISIIGLLASIVFASVSGARTKASDASVQQNLDSIRTQAEIAYSSSSGYANICSDTTISNALNAALNSGSATVVDTLFGDNTASTRVTCRATTGGYLIFAPFKSNSANGWCVDSSGNGKQETNNYTAMNSPATLIVCP